MASRELIKQSLFMLNLAGINPTAHGHYTFLRTICSTAALFITNFNMLLECIVNWNGLDSIEAFTIFLAVYQAFLKLFLVIVNGKRLNNIIYKMEDFWAFDSAEKTVKDDIEKIFTVARIFAKFMIIVMILMLPAFFIFPLLQNPRLLPYPVYYPRDLTKSPDYQLAYVLQIYASFNGISVTFGFDGLFLSLKLHIICQIKLIKKSLETLPIEENREDKTLRCLYRIVDHHNLVLSCIQDLKRMYSSMLLNMYFCNMLIICTGLLGIIASGFPPTYEAISKYGLLTIFISFQLFFYCLSGNYLITEHEGIPQSIYNSKWYVKTQPRLRRACLMVIQRGNKKEELTAGGMFSLNLESFRKVMRAAMSFFTLVQALYKK